MEKFVSTQNGGTLNLRAMPATSSSILARIPNGTSVTIIEEEGEWSKIQYQGTIGYVMSKFLATSNSSLREIYNKLKETLALIETELKRG